MISLALVVALSGVPPTSSTTDLSQPISLRQASKVVLYGRPETENDPRWESSTLGGGSAVNYCQATVNSFGTACSISHVGSMALSDDTFGLMATGAPQLQNSWGMFTYGTTQTNVPFANGYLCISPFASGIFRMHTQRLGSGTVVCTMAAHPSDFALFTAGSTWNYQFWYRDPPAQGAYFNLSDGLQVTFAP